jgi:uncharacterized protein
MAANVLVDAGFVVALLSKRDSHHDWATSQAERSPPPWQTCEAVLSESFHLLGASGREPLSDLLRRSAVIPSFDLREQVDRVAMLMDKYANVPMSLADACLVRMTELSAKPIVLTTDRDFRVYRRNGRHVIPCRLPV